MNHCWTARYEAEGWTWADDAAMDELNRRWPATLSPEIQTDDPWLPWSIVKKYVTETCMLDAGHAGAHEFQDIGDWQLTFAGKAS